MSSPARAEHARDVWPSRRQLRLGLFEGAGSSTPRDAPFVDVLLISAAGAADDTGSCRGSAPLPDDPEPGCLPTGAGIEADFRFDGIDAGNPVEVDRVGAAAVEFHLSVRHA
jgi:hypothetical protein